MYVCMYVCMYECRYVCKSGYVSIYKHVFLSLNPNPLPDPHQKSGIPPDALARQEVEIQLVHFAVGPFSFNPLPGNFRLAIIALAFCTIANTS